MLCHSRVYRNHQPAAPVLVQQVSPSPCYCTCHACLHVIYQMREHLEMQWNSERRKEKSRDAARCRRSRETEIFSALAAALPLSPGCCAQLDKASIMRLAISFLKIRRVIELAPARSVTNGKTEISDALFLQALQGFLLVVSADGDMVFLSENVSEHLGLTQLELMGNSIFEFSHPCDHDEIREVLGAKPGHQAAAVVPSVEPKGSAHSFFLRMKCTLTSKGRNVNLKAASYKVIHCTGHLVSNSTTLVKTEGKTSTSSCTKKDKEDEKPETQRCLVAIGEPIAHPSNIEIPLDKQTFLSKHSLDMKFTYADDKIGEFLGFNPEDLIGKSVFDYHYALDSEIIDKGFKNLFAKGQCEIGGYRFLAQKGGYVWVVTQATLIYGGKCQQPVSVVCVNFVISGIEHRDEVYSVSQLTVGVEEPPPLIEVPAPVKVPYPLPQGATSKIFAPRTEDMNKGFLMFSEDEPGLTMLKEEADPDDLTHLAPTAGDVCVPLEGSPFLEDMFDELMMQNYCPLPLLPDEDDEPSSSCTPPEMRSISPVPSDPFLPYKSGNTSPVPSLSPDTALQSPDPCSLPSLCSPTDSGTSLSPDTPPSLNDDDVDFTLRAPYIPMEDLPLLVSQEDIMWGASPPPRDDLISSDSPSPSSSSKSESTWSSSSSNCSSGGGSPASNLAQLLLSSEDTIKPLAHLVSGRKINDHGGGLVSPTEALGPLKGWKVKGEATIRAGGKVVPIPSKRVAPEGPSPGETVKRAKHVVGSSELLQRLIGPRSVAPSEWEGGGKGGSVLMNLLDRPGSEDDAADKRELFRKRSFSLLEPDGRAMPNLLELSHQDCEVNAPAPEMDLLQGRELLSALEEALLLG